MKTTYCNGIEIQIFEEEDFRRLKNIYYKWKELNELILQFPNSRRVNIPEIVSEGLFCYQKSCGRTNNSLAGSEDAYDYINNKRIQIKACSIESDLTSFGPNSIWDELYFMHFNISCNRVSVYFISDGLIYNLYVNEKETMKDQQEAGKRPRFSIMNRIIIPMGLQPVFTIDLN